MKRFLPVAGFFIAACFSGCGPGKNPTDSLEDDPYESRTMLYDSGDGYSTQIPEYYEQVFDAGERFPKAPQSVFFSPSQPSNAWGEPNITYHEGRYYMWYHSSPFPGSASLATSRDGVYWREEGYTLIPDEESGRCIGESDIHRFSPDGPYIWSYCIWKKWEDPVRLWPTVAIRFAETDDLINFRRYGSRHELRRDSSRYVGRWDTFFVLPGEEGGWIAAMNTAPRSCRGLGFATSKDGIIWEAKDPICVEVPWLPKAGFVGEVSAFTKLGSKYYLICDSHVGDGWFSKVFVSDDPQGPYRPTPRNYLITHSPDLYDKFHYSADGELLTEGIVWSVPEDNSRWYYHVPPFKKVESDGENLWFKWWPGNEKLRSHPVDIPAVTTPAEKTSALSMLAKPFDVEKGMLIEGNISFKGVQAPGDEINLAAGAKATTSGDFDVRISGGGIDGTPAAALDGNRETVWVPKPQANNPHWYELDMGALQQVGRILVRWTNRSHPDWWKIELSADRVNWKTIGEEAPPNPPEWNIYHASLARTFITGLSERARYMRITIQPNPAGRRTDGGSVEGIVDIGVYGKPYETAGIGAGCPPGLFFECEGGGGEAIIFEPGGQAHYGWLNADGTDFHRELTLEIGTTPGEEAGFRVIWRDELAEVYLDDYYLLMINLRRKATGRMGYINSGGKNLVSGVKAWYGDPEYRQ